MCDHRVGLSAVTISAPLSPLLPKKSVDHSVVPPSNIITFHKADLVVAYDRLVSVPRKNTDVLTGSCMSRSRLLLVRSTFHRTSPACPSQLSKPNYTSRMASGNVDQLHAHARPNKLHGRAFYESLGSPKHILAPMVAQSEYVGAQSPKCATTVTDAVCRHGDD